MKYTSQIKWERHSQPFDVKSYNRTHQIIFGGGISISASSAPEFLGKAELPNPEELFIASIASCFMLTFLYWAANKSIVIDEYHSEVVGTLAKNTEGKMAITEVSIKPTIAFQENKLPDANVLEELFQKAHDNCFITSSVKSKVLIENNSSTCHQPC